MFVETIKGIKGIMDPFSFLLSSVTWIPSRLPVKSHLCTENTATTEQPKNMVSLDFDLGTPKKKNQA